MKKLKLFILALFAVGVAFVVQNATMQNNKASATERCHTVLVDGEGNHGIKVNQAKTEVYATIIVRGDANCRRPASLAVWKLPNAQGHPLTAQKFFGHTTKMYAPGRHTIRATLPKCYWQADLLWQMRPKSIHGDARYDWSNNPNVPRDILANFRLGGDKSCTPPKPEPPVKDPTCSISVSKNEIKQGEKVTLSWSSQNTTGGAISGIGPVASNGSKEMTIDTSTKFVAIFTGKNGKKVSCDTTVTVIVDGKPIPPTTPTTPEVEAVTDELPETLPNTGSGAVVAIVSSLTATLSGVGHYFYQKRKRFLV
jgi:hypothetical protein